MSPSAQPKRFDAALRKAACRRAVASSSAEPPITIERE
jgi:hypothetical protein